MRFAPYDAHALGHGAKRLGRIRSKLRRFDARRARGALRRSGGVAQPVADFGRYRPRRSHLSLGRRRDRRRDRISSGGARRPRIAAGDFAVLPHGRPADLPGLRRIRDAV
jgi:hypothetical protein